MPRPCKKRRVCYDPAVCCFRPEGVKTGGEAVVMSLEEYETIRLIDLQELTQEECAGQMQVARTTVQAVYNSARKKLAECLVNARVLEIGGGNYTLCEHGRKCRSGDLSVPGCARAMAGITDCFSGRKEINMKIAVTYENGKVFQHFGHTEQFKLYEVKEDQITGTEVVDTNGSGHGALSGFLKDKGVEVLICGGIGGGARTALAEAGIKLYPGAEGEADQCVEALLKGSLSYNPDTVCSHHHGEGHQCGEHKHGCSGH